MARVEFTARVDADGILRLELPLGASLANQDVVIKVAAPEQHGRPDSDRPAWQQPFVDEMAGNWQEDLERPPRNERGQE